MIRSSKELSQKDLTKYCALFIGGGNTYKLLYELKKYRNFEKIQTFLKNNGKIFGGSAGSIIFGKDIDVCSVEDKNDVGLVDTKGFNLLNDISILCHLNKKTFKRNYQFLKNYSKNQKAIFLPEENVIVIENKKIYSIGNKKYALFDNSKHVLHHFANLKKDIEKRM